MNTSGLDKIKSRYDGDHDLGPDAPVHWTIMELVDIIEQLVEVVNKQQREIDRLKSNTRGIEPDLSYMR